MTHRSRGRIRHGGSLPSHEGPCYREGPVANPPTRLSTTPHSAQGVFANYIKQGLINYKKHLTKGSRDYLVLDIFLNLRTEEER